MIKLLTIIGARPQIIKASAISRAIANHFATEVCEKILHTGQHYDANMSQVFFDELNIPYPNFNLNVGSGTHAVQTAKMMVGIEEVIQKEHFDGMIIYGDTNSTLAGGIVASKLHLPVFHIEAGLRSFNMFMPEELNRVLCDQLSSILFTPTQTAIDNLRKEGFDTSPTFFKNGKRRMVIHSGDIMYDNSLYFAQLSSSKEKLLKELGVSKGDYLLATIHRDSNTDNPERLRAIFEALIRISSGEKIVCPLHPRTVARLNDREDIMTAIRSHNNLIITAPVSFLEITMLEKNAKLILTDSGGVQKEAYFFQKPCVILRPETEWVEIIEQGAGILADADTKKILNSYQQLIGNTSEFPTLFGDGNSAKYIIKEIVNYCNNEK
ncbi:MAG: UDP-N-acetylglucosamine 2-epimerase (non-hydrolyzing) [Bacteroidales bacterium]